MDSEEAEDLSFIMLILNMPPLQFAGICEDLGIEDPDDFREYLQQTTKGALQ